MRIGVKKGGKGGKRERKMRGGKTQMIGMEKRGRKGHTRKRK